MSKHLKIAVVSDLHCKHGKESIISTHLYTESPRIPREHHPVEALKILINEDRITSDILLCPGDLTDKADKQGLVSGWGFIKEISKDLKSKFYTSSVGNHDVNSREKESNPFQFLISFHPSFPINNKTLKSFFWANDKHFFVYEGEDFVLLNFNSSYNHVDAERAHKSLIGDEIIERIENEIKSYTDSPKIKIALFHHHPQPYANIDQAYKDSDLIERGGQLLQLLEKLKFDLVIHGHKHLPKLDYFNRCLPTFCAGSFSSTMNVLDVSGKNTFHIIEIEKKERQSKGKIKTWEYIKGHGWGKSSSALFFPWITGFGSEESIRQIEEDIVSLLNEQNEGVVYYNDLLGKIPEIEYLTPSEQNTLTTNLLVQGIEFIPILKLGPRLVIKQIK